MAIAIVEGDSGMTGENAKTLVPTPGTLRGRRYSVYDAMILIAGMAFLLAYDKYNIITLLQQLTYLCKTIAAYYGFISAKPYGPPQLLLNSMATYWSTVLWYVVQSSEQAILIMTPVFLLMRVRGPRPPVGRLLRQPGTVAGLAIPFGVIWVTGWLHRLFFGRIVDGTVTAIAVGGTVAIAWTCLALGRRWEAEPNWVDRMGRLLGASAIAVAMLAYSVFGI